MSDQHPAHPPSETPVEVNGPRDADPDPDRRRFLAWTWRALGAGLAAGAGWTVYDALKPSVSEGFGGQVPAGAADAFPEGKVRYFPQGRFYVTRVEGDLLALYQRCPHLGCRVPFCESSQQFECPCHGSIFNLKGEFVAGPSPRGLDRFAVHVGEEGVVVDTGRATEGPRPGDFTMTREPQGPRCIDALPEDLPLHEDESPHGGSPHNGGNDAD